MNNVGVDGPKGNGRAAERSFRYD